MKDYFCPADELITTDLEGYLEAGDDGEIEQYDLNGERVVDNGNDE